MGFIKELEAMAFTNHYCDDFIGLFAFICSRISSCPIHIHIVLRPSKCISWESLRFIMILRLV